MYNLIKFQSLNPVKHNPPLPLYCGLDTTKQKPGYFAPGSI